MENTEKNTNSTFQKTTDTLIKELETMSDAGLHDLFIVVYHLSAKNGYMVYGWLSPFAVHVKLSQHCQSAILQYKIKRFFKLIQ